MLTLNNVTTRSEHSFNVPCVNGSGEMRVEVVRVSGIRFSCLAYPLQGEDEGSCDLIVSLCYEAMALVGWSIMAMALVGWNIMAMALA